MEYDWKIEHWQKRKRKSQVLGRGIDRILGVVEKYNSHFLFPILYFRRRTDMSTNTRPELSDKNQWWISKHRYYELKHFCLQYPTWTKTLSEFEQNCITAGLTREHINAGRYSDKVANMAISLSPLQDKTEMVNKAAYEACGHQFWYQILIEAVTENVSYDVLEARIQIMPVSRNEWYVLYRKFFWCLDKLRD